MSNSNDKIIDNMVYFSFRLYCIKNDYDYYTIDKFNERMNGKSIPKTAINNAKEFIKILYPDTEPNELGKVVEEILKLSDNEIKEVMQW